MTWLIFWGSENLSLDEYWESVDICLIPVELSGRSSRAWLSAYPMIGRPTRTTLSDRNTKHRMPGRSPTDTLKKRLEERTVTEIIRAFPAWKLTSGFGLFFSVSMLKVNRIFSRSYIGSKFFSRKSCSCIGLGSISMRLLSALGWVIHLLTLSSISIDDIVELVTVLVLTSLLRVDCPSLTCQIDHEIKNPSKNLWISFSSTARSVLETTYSATH